MRSNPTPHPDAREASRLCLPSQPRAGGRERSGASSMNLTTRLLIATLTGLVFGAAALSQTVAYKRIRVADGPTLEYPAHWVLADEATIQNRVHAAQATADAAGIDISGFQKRNRVVIESLPRPNAAQIRASIVTPQEYSQEDLKATSTEDLRSLKRVFEESFRKMSAAGTVKVQKVGDLRVESIAGRLALIVPYTRNTEANSELWQVEQIKIPFDKRMLSMTISYRIADLNTMKPILERVKRSVQF